MFLCAAVPACSKEYFIETGQRHYYFMNVGNGEVIDASRRVSIGGGGQVALLAVVALCARGQRGGHQRQG